MPWWESFFRDAQAGMCAETALAHASESAARAGRAIFDGWYNRERRHSSLDYLSPIAYEQQDSGKLPNPGVH